MKQHSDLIRFLSDIKVTSDGTVPMSNLEHSDIFVSELYEPEYSVSVLAIMTLSYINNGEFEEVSTPVHPETITGKVLSSDLSTYAPEVYLLTRLIVLETFSLVFSIHERRDNLRYVSKRDIARVKNNINYLTDYLGTEDKYLNMIEPLRNIHVSLGYIEHQIDVIISSGRGR